MSNLCSDANRRHDFVLLFDVTDGNPNGDPDAGNLPRVDPETMHGLVTDVCLKRKVRDYVNALHGNEARYKIYVEHRSILNRQHQRAYDDLDIKSTGSKQKSDDINKARQWMCQNFYDVRAFGAVMTTGVNCGQVRGAAQFTFARSIDPIVPLDLSITRVAVTREEDAVQFIATAEGSGETRGKETEMGRKAIVPYGLYRAYGFINAKLAEQTGFNNEDLALLWEALERMWDLDRSASRGLMACRGLYVFTHDNPLGRAPAHRLFERVGAHKRDDVETPRKFNDYVVEVNDRELPEGVTLTRFCEG